MKGIPLGLFLLYDNENGFAQLGPGSVVPDALNTNPKYNIAEREQESNLPTHFQKSLSNLIKWSFTFLKHNEGGLKWPLFFYDWRRIYEYNTRPTTGIVEANSRI